MKERLLKLYELALPKPLRRHAMQHIRRQTRRPRVGRVDFGGLRRLSPLSREWGYDRGKPIDRYYIERFLEKRAPDIRGRVLEIGTNEYTRAFGGEQVTRSDVLHVSEDHPNVTLIADLTKPDQFSPNVFDCVILTQTLHVIYDMRAALTTAYRILKPGGVLLATGPGISQISRYDMDHWGDYWRFTTRALQRLVEESFPSGDVKIEAYGNVLACTAFLHGLAVEELEQSELEHFDPDYELLITVRAQKAEAV